MRLTDKGERWAINAFAYSLAIVGTLFVLGLWGLAGWLEGQ
ncbi:MAG: hypothetical protein JW384_02328 [Nitrosomonadaceae bacterium]|jgi:hypothetical protein|nr:hypothetical protein [Nitrosomonadaceae bacterium]